MDRGLDRSGAAVSIRARYLLIAPPLIFLGVFYFYPLISIFGLSFSPEASGYGSGLGKLFAKGYHARVLWFTTWQAALSTLLTLVCALPGAYVFATYRFRGKNLIQALTAIPFVLPTVVTAAAFKALLGDSGLANRWLMGIFGLEDAPIRLDHTVWFFLLAHVFYNYTVVLRIVGGFWSRLPSDLLPAAYMLGASRWQAFWRITLPLLTPAILAASLLVFVFCFTSFGTVLILGGPRLATLEVEIYRQAVHLFNLPIAAALSLVQIIFTFALMAVYTWFEKKSAVSMMPGMDSSGIPARTKRSRWIIRGSLGFLALLLGAPLAALLISSVWGDGGPTLAYYLGLFTSREQSILYVPPFGAMLNSLGYALAASLIAVALGWFAAGFLASPHSRSASWLDPILMLPLSTSAVTLGFGFIIALDEPP
jgi:thiamine transport system permease protein